MRIPFVSAMAAWLAGCGLALAQLPAAPRPAHLPPDTTLLTSERDVPTSPASATGSPYANKDQAVPLQPEPGINPLGNDAGQPSDCCGNRAEGGSVFANQETGVHRDRVWANAEYLLWWIHGNQAPPLIGTLPANLASANPADLPPGAINTLFGGSQIRFGAFSGGRFDVGVWLDPEQCCALEGNFLFLGRRNVNFAAASPGGLSPVVGPLFFDVVAGRESIIVPVDPLNAVEHASAHASESMWGYEVNFKSRVAYFAKSPFDVFAGFRYLNFEDNLSVNSDIDFLGQGSIGSFDSFTSRTEFYGGQVGASFDLREGPWSMTVIGKVAIGGVHESIEINGLTTETFASGGQRILPGGVLAQKTNTGHFTQEEFATLPELTLNFGYQVTPCLRVYVGYNILYLDHAMRSADVIDGVNPSLINGLIVTNPSTVARPQVIFKETDMFAQGINFGLEFRY